MISRPERREKGANKFVMYERHGDGEERGKRKAKTQKDRTTTQSKHKANVTKHLGKEQQRRATKTKQE